MAMGPIESKEEFARAERLGAGYRCLALLARASNGLLDLLFGAEEDGEEEARSSSEKLTRLYYDMRP